MAKAFDKEVEYLRGLIAAKAKPFTDDKAEQRERVKRSATDLEFFGRTYFPHYISSAPSKLHKYFCDRYPKMIFAARDTGLGDKEADAAPRGNAKSTWTSFILPLWCAAYKYRKFPLILSETATQAEDFIQFIKLELESNERLKQDFPALVGDGPVWRSDTIITRNGVKIRGAGSGQKLRGMRHGSTRPDLVIGDDLENDEAVESQDQRKKLEKWFFKALMKIGQKDTIYIVVGTILHYDSLLSDLLQKPGWKGVKFRAIIKYSESKLWERWEQIFTDITVGKQEAEDAADAFYRDNEAEMLAGTEVLWPEVENYYYLMKMRVSDGPAYFDSEKQNEPINPDDCLFKDEWFMFWDEDEVDLAGCPHYGVVDPSLGKKAKGRDPSAVLGGRVKKMDGGKIIYLDIADIEKRHPDKIITDILTYHKRDPFELFGCESVQFQEYFAGNIEKTAHALGVTLNVVEIRSVSDKFLRIQKLQPWIKNGWIRFHKNMITLLNQLKFFPKADHDDGPDALEMLCSLVEGSTGPAEPVGAPSGVPRESSQLFRGF